MVTNIINFEKLEKIWVLTVVCKDDITNTEEKGTVRISPPFESVGKHRTSLCSSVFSIVFDGDTTESYSVVPRSIFHNNQVYFDILKIIADEILDNYINYEYITITCEIVQNFQIKIMAALISNMFRVIGFTSDSRKDIVRLRRNYYRNESNSNSYNK